MASEGDHVTVFNEDDDDDEEPLNDIVLDDDEDAAAGGRAPDADDCSDSDDADTNSTSSAAVPAVPLSSSSVSIAVLPPSSGPVNGSDPSPAVAPSLAATTAVIAMAAPNAMGMANPVVEKKPIDDSRKLFQKMWSDEDEIELLQGFLEYTTQRGPNWTGHNDTTAFYDQIKSRLQLDCNKNQLVEKLRRLKKKYRNVVSRVSAGKDFVFKTPHDQATFEISRKIWGNSISQRQEFDDDDQNPNPVTGSTVVSTFHTPSDQRAPGGFGIDINSSEKMMMINMGTPNRSRKRSRVKMEENSSRNMNSAGYETPANPAPVQGMVEERVRSCLPPLLKDFFDNSAGGSGFGAGGSKGIGSLISSAIPMNFPGVSLGNCGDVVDERWRKQLILELEVYSKRLELVQDQIKLTLEELKSRGG